MTRLRTKVATLLILPAAVLILVALVVPLLYLLRFSFYASGDAMETGGDFGFQNFSKLLHDDYMVGMFCRTLGLSLLVTVICFVLGLPAATMIWRAGRRWKPLLTILVLSPLLVSIVVSSYGWVVLLGNQGVVNTVLTKLGLITQPLTMLYTDVSLVVGLVHVLLPFMVLSLSAALERVDPLLSEAAMTLGATRARVWRHVLLPLALPGIGSGATIVFALAMSSYVTPAVLGPNGPNFVTTLIYQYFISLYDWATGSALAVTLLVLSMASVAAYSAVINRFSFAEGRRA